MSYSANRECERHTERSRERRVFSETSLREQRENSSPERRMRWDGGTAGSLYHRERWEFEERKIIIHILSTNPLWWRVAVLDGTQSWLLWAWFHAHHSHPWIFKSGPVWIKHSFWNRLAEPCYFEYAAKLQFRQVHREVEKGEGGTYEWEK